jgi:hypothetical protein
VTIPLTTNNNDKDSRPSIDSMVTLTQSPAPTKAPSPAITIVVPATLTPSVVPILAGTCVAGLYNGVHTMHQTGGDLVLVFVNGSRPNGTGVINRVEGGYIIGYMNFPDDRTYTLNFRVADNKIYWDGKRGETSNIWTRSTVFECTLPPITCVAGVYNGVVTMHQTGGDLVLVYDNGSRPDGTGVIDTLEGGYAIGYMNFPDDRTYTLNFRIADNKIYWDGKMGETNNIWTISTALDCT